MSRTGKGKLVYVNIPSKLYAAMLQDIESRPRGISVEAVVQECIRDRYASAKVKREYLVRAGLEVAGIQGGSGDPASLHAGPSFPTAYGMGSGLTRPRPRPRGRPRKDASARRG